MSDHSSSIISFSVSRWTRRRKRKSSTNSILQIFDNSLVLRCVIVVVSLLSFTTVVSCGAINGSLSSISSSSSSSSSLPSTNDSSRVQLFNSTFEGIVRNSIITSATLSNNTTTTTTTELLSSTVDQRSPLTNSSAYLSRTDNSTNSLSSLVVSIVNGPESRQRLNRSLESLSVLSSAGTHNLLQPEVGVSFDAVNHKSSNLNSDLSSQNATRHEMSEDFLQQTFAPVNSFYRSSSIEMMHSRQHLHNETCQRCDEMTPTVSQDAVKAPQQEHQLGQQYLELILDTQNHSTAIIELSKNNVKSAERENSIKRTNTDRIEIVEQRRQTSPDNSSTEKRQSTKRTARMSKKRRQLPVDETMGVSKSTFSNIHSLSSSVGAVNLSRTGNSSDTNIQSLNSSSDGASVSSQTNLDGQETPSTFFDQTVSQSKASETFVSVNNSTTATLPQNQALIQELIPVAASHQIQDRLTVNSTAGFVGGPTNKNNTLHSLTDSTNYYRFAARENDATSLLSRYPSLRIPSPPPEYADEFHEAMTELTSVAGETIELPCNTTSWSNDEVSLVLWFRGDTGVPIYRVDARAVSLDASHHTTSDELRKRLFFDTTSSPPVLRISPVIATDAAEYRCRVDFRHSRTQNVLVSLNVTVPPKELLIMDVEGQKLEGVIGPYDESSAVLLICEAEGGKPSPWVHWFIGATAIDTTFTTGPHGLVRNELTLRSVNRSDFMSILTCRASNNNVTEPISATVILDMNLRPLDVKIVERESKSPEIDFVPSSSSSVSSSASSSSVDSLSTSLLPTSVILSAGARSEFHCHSSGSRPAAQISWWLGAERLSTNIRDSVSEDGNSSHSTIHFVPAIADHSKTLTCRADNLPMPHTALKDEITLDVQFAPQLRISFGSSIDADGIKEGSDVYLECKVRSNPPVKEVLWLRDGAPLQASLNSDVMNMGDGPSRALSSTIIMTNQSLVIQKVSRAARGRYQCVAINEQGESISDVLQLKVNFAPICKSGQKVQYGVSRHEQIRIRCEVDAEPTNDLSFRWTLNTSGGDGGTQDWSQFSVNSSTSIAAYRPESSGDYGTFLCVAQNSIGKQSEPCIYHVVPAGRPDPVGGCAITNHSMSTLLVECVPGDDGGLRQLFNLEVYLANSQKLHSNHTSSQANFLVSTLVSGTHYTLVLYATNAKGRSHSVSLSAVTLSSPEKHVDGGSIEQIVVNPILAVLIGIVAAIVLITILLVLILRSRSQQNTSNTTKLVQRSPSTSSEEKPLKVRIRKGSKQRNDSNSPYGKDSEAPSSPSMGAVSGDRSTGEESIPMMITQCRSGVSGTSDHCSMENDRMVNDVIELTHNHHHHHHHLTHGQPQGQQQQQQQQQSHGHSHHSHHRWPASLLEPYDALGRPSSIGTSSQHSVSSSLATVPISAELLKANCMDSSANGQLTMLHHTLDSGEMSGGGSSAGQQLHLELGSTGSTVSSATPPNLLPLQRMILLTSSDIVSDSASSSSPSHHGSAAAAASATQYHHHQPYLNYSHNFGTPYDIPTHSIDALYRDSQFVIPASVAGPGTNYVLSSHPSSSSAAVTAAAASVSSSQVPQTFLNNSDKYSSLSRRVGLLDQGEFTPAPTSAELGAYLHLKSSNATGVSMGTSDSSNCDPQIELLDQQSTSNAIETPYATLRSHQIILNSSPKKGATPV